MSDPIKSNDYLPRFDQDKDIFKNLTQIIDYVLGEYEKEYKYIADKYKDYFNFEDIDGYLTKESAIKELIEEKGFGYIYDVLNLPTEDVSTVYSYLKFFRYFKGTREGLEVIFTLLGFIQTDTYIPLTKTFDLEEWWEMIPEGDPHTFDLELEMPLDEYTVSFQEDIENFIRNYVYPIMKLQLGLYFTIVASEFTTAGFVDESIEGDIEMASLQEAIFFTSDRDGNRDIYYTLNEFSTVHNLTNDSSTNKEFDVHPSGEYMCFISNRSGLNQLYELEIASGITTKLSTGGNAKAFTSYSPTGRYIAFTDVTNLYVYDRLTTSTTTIYTTVGTETDVFLMFWQPNETNLYFHVQYSNSQVGQNLFRADVNGSWATTKLTTYADSVAGGLAAGIFSPDGSRGYYVDFPTSQDIRYTTNFNAWDNTGTALLNDGVVTKDQKPVPFRDGSKILYRDNNPSPKTIGIMDNDGSNNNSAFFSDVTYEVKLGGVSKKTDAIVKSVRLDDAKVLLQVNDQIYIGDLSTGVKNNLSNNAFSEQEGIYANILI